MLRQRRKKGQAIVEMALIFPFFLLVIVGGIVDFGFAFYNMLALQQLANDAAMYCAENTTATTNSDNATRNYIANYSTPPMGWHQPNIYTANISTISMLDGSRMKKVEISYKSKTYTPFYQTMVSAVNGNDSITIKTSAVYKVPNVVVKR